jgi:probable HAF family extracellular repeat protein
MITLNDSTVAGIGTAWLHVVAADINNAGQIVGYRTNNQSNYQAFLLTPVIPEPHTAGIVAMGAVMIILRTRRRRLPRYAA